MSPGQTALHIEGLRHEYSSRVILDLPELRIAPGEHMLFLGPSGSGKSTLLHIIAGILTPTAGRVVVAGHDYATLSPASIDRVRGRHVGIVLQTLHMIAALTVRQNLRLTRSLAGLPVDEARIDAVLEALNISTLADQRPPTLSHGEVQRGAIARALINAPALILADEPTSALDDTNCGMVVDLLLRQAAASQATLLIATHDGRIADRFKRKLHLELTP